MKKFIWIAVFLTFTAGTAVFAETPDDNNQCSNTGAAAKRETALNKQAHTASENTSTSQQAYEDCLDSAFIDLIRKGIGAALGLDISILVKAANEACEHLRDTAASYSKIFDVETILKGAGIYAQGNIDEVSRQLQQILAKELRDATRSVTKFKVPDLSSAGSQNVLKEILIMY